MRRRWRMQRGVCGAAAQRARTNVKGELLAARVRVQGACPLVNLWLLSFDKESNTPCRCAAARPSSGERTFTSTNYFPALLRPQLTDAKKRTQKEGIFPSSFFTWFFTFHRGFSTGVWIYRCFSTFPRGRPQAAHRKLFPGKSGREPGRTAFPQFPPPLLLRLFYILSSLSLGKNFQMIGAAGRRVFHREHPLPRPGKDR